MVVNPEMLRSRSITFQVLMTSYQVISSFSFSFSWWETQLLWQLICKMHGVLGIQAIKFQLDPFLYVWGSVIKIYIKKITRDVLPATLPATRDNLPATRDPRRLDNLLKRQANTCMSDNQTRERPAYSQFHNKRGGGGGELQGFWKIIKRGVKINGGWDKI